MEISIPVSGVFQFSSPPPVKTASTDPTPLPVQQAQQVEFPLPVAASTTGTTTPTDPSQQQDTAAIQAALSFKNVYAVSDTASSTYKDVTGALITRSVSLRDGTVTYSPEPQYVRPPAASVSIEA